MSKRDTCFNLHNAASRGFPVQLCEEALPSKSTTCNRLHPLGTSEHPFNSAAGHEPRSLCPSDRSPVQENTRLTLRAACFQELLTILAEWQTTCIKHSPRKRNRSLSSPRSKTLALNLSALSSASGKLPPNRASTNRKTNWRNWRRVHGAPNHLMALMQEQTVLVLEVHAQTHVHCRTVPV